MKITTFKNGTTVINCTGHKLKFFDEGELVEIEADEIVLEARTIYEKISTFVEQEEVIGTQEGWDAIDKIHEEYPTVFILATPTVTKAYNGAAVYAKAHTGYEHTPILDRRYTTEGFRLA